VAVVIFLALVAALLFLHTNLLQFIRRSHYPQHGPQIPPGNQGLRSPSPQMVRFPYPPGSPSAIPYSENTNYHDHPYNSPPYSEHPSHGLPPSSIMAELPSPGEKNPQEYAVMDVESRDVPSPASTPQPESRPFSFCGRSRSMKTKYEQSSKRPFSVEPFH